MQVVDEIGQELRGHGRARPPGKRAYPEPQVGRSDLAREDPTVPWQGPPPIQRPHGDGGQIDRLWKVRSHRESPKDLVGIDEAGNRGHSARRSIGADDRSGLEYIAGAGAESD